MGFDDKGGNISQRKYRYVSSEIRLCERGKTPQKKDPS